MSPVDWPRRKLNQLIKLSTIENLRTWQLEAMNFMESTFHFFGYTRELRA